MADTFLDTELTPDGYRHIADVIVKARYSAAEAETIYREDVAPAFAANLMSVAGEWAGWSEDYVRERVLEKRGSRVWMITIRFFMGEDIEEEWSRIAALLPPTI